MITTNEFSKLTTTLFSASLGALPWEQFLSECSALCADSRTHMFGYDTVSKTSLDMLTCGYDPEKISEYEAHYGQLNAWAVGFGQANIGRVTPAHAMCPVEKLKSTEFYHDWVKPQEDITRGGGALLFRSDDRFFALGANIREKDGDEAEQKWLALVEKLVPQMRVALDVNRSLGGASLESHLIASQGILTVPAVVIVSELGRVIWANSLAEKMLSLGDPISVGHAEKVFVHTDGGIRGTSIDELFSHVRSASFHHSSRAVYQRYKFQLLKLSPEGQSFFPFGASIGVSNNCSVLIVTSVGISADLISRAIMRFGLTQAEAEVAFLVMDGLLPNEIADHRNVSLNTVRNQIKAVLSKMAISRASQISARFRAP